MKKRVIQTMIMLLLVVGLFLVDSGSVQAASSYTNAKEFYETANTFKDYRVETYNTSVYYATKAKLAVSNNLMYHTVGFDVEMEAGGKSVSFTVKRNGLLKQVDSRSDGTYEYILYQIPTDTLYNLAMKANATVAKTILGQSKITVYMDAIVVTKTGSTLGGNITEDGFGGITSSGTIYRLKNTADLNRLKSIFNGHNFTSYYNIVETLDNFQLNIYYNANGGTISSNYSLGSFAGYDNAIFKSGSAYKDSYRGLGYNDLTDIGTFGLSKKGYHVERGKEWLSNTNRVFSQNTKYYTKEYHSEAGLKDINLMMFANWKPNTYTIHYHANGGVGTVAATTATYDSSVLLRANTFTRVGYKQGTYAWNTKPDGTGTNYSSGQLVKNLIEQDGGVLNLYAVWEPEEYTIYTHKDNGTGGDNVFYELYDNYFFKETGIGISSIIVPTREGYTLDGYYMGFNGTGDKITDANGKFLVSSTYFTSDNYIKKIMSNSSRLKNGVFLS